MTTPQPEETVSVEAAYQAARDRAHRTTDALILAEAQIITLQRDLLDLGEENTRVVRQLEDVQEQLKTYTGDAAEEDDSDGSYD